MNPPAPPGSAPTASLLPNTAFTRRYVQQRWGHHSSVNPIRTAYFVNSATLRRCSFRMMLCR